MAPNSDGSRYNEMVVRASGTPTASPALTADRRGLQPVDANRLLVANFVLEADVDILARFQHLFGGLREARLVAVDRRNLEEPRQECDRRESDQQGYRALMRRAGIIQYSGRPARGTKSLTRLFGRRTHRPSVSKLFGAIQPDNKLKPRLCHLVQNAESGFGPWKSCRIKWMLRTDADAVGGARGAVRSAINVFV